MHRCPYLVVMILLASAGLAVAQSTLPEPMPAPQVPSIAEGIYFTRARSRLWVNADYLMWWMSGDDLPPLLISGNPPLGTTATRSIPFPVIPGSNLVTTPNAGGVVAPLSLTQVLVGGNDFDHAFRSGGRFTVGYWLDDDQNIAVEASYFFLGPRTRRFSTGSFDHPRLAIPFVDALTGLETSYPIAQPGFNQTFSTTLVLAPAGGIVTTLPISTTTISDAFTGAVSITSSSQLDGETANAIWRISRGPEYHIDFLAGFRHLRLRDRLEIRSDVLQNHTESTVTPGVPILAVPPSTIINNFESFTTRSDRFEALNNFYGAQIGARGEYRFGRLSLAGGGTLAMGTMHERVRIAGNSVTSTTATVTPTAQVLPGIIPIQTPIGNPVTTQTVQQSNAGLFAQPGNPGGSRNMFAVVPEVNLKVGYDLSSRFRATVGYSFLYVSEVARAGEQIDRVINPALLANPPGTGSRPAFLFRGTDLWAQGVDFGLEFHY